MISPLVHAKCFCYIATKSTFNSNFSTCVLFLCFKSFECIALPVDQVDWAVIEQEIVMKQNLVGLFWVYKLLQYDAELVGIVLDL
jgi:hypothetical protein